MSNDDEPRVIVEKRSGGVGMLLLGLAIGAGVALLFAPQSGAETRRKIVRGARRMRRAAGHVADHVADGVTDHVGETFDAARDSLAAKRGKVERAMHAGREAAAQAREDLERRLAETKAAYQAGARVARDQSRDD